MAILVTGGCGYIGSVTVDLLQAAGREPVVVDNLGRGHRSAISPEVQLYQGDVGNAGLLRQIASDHDLESCIHFAALTYVGESVERPQLYYQNNVGQGVTLLQTLMECGLRQFVFSSSCAVYGEPERLPLGEEHPRRPENPYGWGKLFMEQVLDRFAANYALRFMALRYFNAAGASRDRGEDHDPETHLIPIVLEAASGIRPHVTIFGDDYPTTDGTAMRDYVHVEDLGAAHMAAVDHLANDGPVEFVNIGTGRGHSVREVIDTVSEVTGRPIATRTDRRRSGDASQLVANNDKARRLLGWQPAHSDLKGIVESAWQWRRAHPDGYRD